VVLFPTLAALGLISALVYAAGGKLWTSITLHALNNAVGVVALIVTTIHKH
jgi:membrane protease YdiL (CAAX protease family)